MFWHNFCYNAHLGRNLTAVKHLTTISWSQAVTAEDARQPRHTATLLAHPLLTLLGRGSLTRDISFSFLQSCLSETLTAGSFRFPLVAREVMTRVNGRCGADRTQLSKTLRGCRVYLCKLDTLKLEVNASKAREEKYSLRYSATL